ncbi:MAG: TetR/AcrR family transcriptional regulator [Magnetococcus sp. YQC-5]
MGVAVVINQEQESLTGLSPKALATRERIVKAAFELFSLHGYHATGLERIIRAAGVAKGNFYHHFKGKEALAVATLSWYMEKMRTEVGLDDILADPSPLHGLWTLLEGMASQTRCAETGNCQIRGCFIGNLALELSVDHAPVRRKVAEIFDMVREVIRTLITHAQQLGEIRPDLDPDQTAGMILTMMEGATLMDKTRQNSQDMHGAIYFLKGYLSP